MPPTAALGGEVSLATRTEHDLLGELEVPVHALFGIHTERALHNFPRHGLTVSDVLQFASAFGMVKLAAARANVACGVLDPDIANAPGPQQI
jgi:aspartate ammonia-lyase